MSILAQAQELGSPDSMKSHGLQKDVFLHPGDMPTALTLRKREWIYAQSPNTLPFPSWAMVGLTDRVTLELDLLPFFFGFLTPSRRPIPSTNVRVRVLDQKKYRPSLAVEVMAFHIWDTITRYDTRNLYIRVRGTGGFMRINSSWVLHSNLYLHTSVGTVYQAQLWMSNRDTHHFRSVFFQDRVTPDFSIGLDYRPFGRISFFVKYAYGSTFTYIENIPNKRQFIYGFRLAPFYKSKYGFFRTMRAEFVAIFAYFPDIGVYQDLKLPIYGYLYWQWLGKRKTP
jgi:hypothetical protein